MPMLAIVGGAGFVGTNLARAAVAQGYQVLLYDIEDRLGRYGLAGLAEHQQVSLVCVDAASTALAFPAEVTAVVHLAALAHVDYSVYRPVRAFENNVMALARVCQEAVQREIPVLFTSSVEVYGGNEGPPFPESSAYTPLSPYAASKVAGEALVASMIPTLGLQATVVRLTNLYGPYQAPDRLIPRIITQIMCGEPCEADNERLRDYVFVEDAVGALLAIIEQDAWGHTLNISSGQPHTNLSVATRIAHQMGYQDRIERLPVKTDDGRGPSLIGSPDQIARTIGWQASTDLETGLATTIGWYKKQLGWWVRYGSNVCAARSGPDFLIDYTTDWADASEPTAAGRP